VEVQDADNRTVYIVTTAGNYKYLGRLDATFDANGEVTGFVAAESYPRRVIPTSQVATDLGLTDAVTPDAGIVTSVIEPVEACLEDLADPLFGSEVLLDVSRNGVRGQETNAGNLIADSYLYAYNQLAGENGLTVPITRVIAIQNGGGIRQNAGDQLPTSGVVPGTISRLDTKNVLAFFNTMTVVEEVTPTELKQIFERSVSNIGGGQFLQIGGLNIVYNPANQAQVIGTDGTVTTPGQRITSITLDDGTPIVSGGNVVSGAPSVAIVTNSFTANGGDNYPWLGNNTSKTQLFDENGVALTYEETWVRYLLNSTTDFPETTIGDFTGPAIQDDDPRYQPGVNVRITTP
jgi:5'-nucleotidase